jgi:hypothetical protein
MNAALPGAVSKVIDDERLQPVESDFIRTKILPVIAERQEFLVDALKSRQSPLSDLINSRELSAEVVDRLRRPAAFE